jgi:peptidoglycan hydrolase-like protein with peptidoglycan-binding domain
MRVSILALSVLGILVSAGAVKAGPSTTDRELSTSAQPVSLTDEATQQTEDQIGLDKAKRRDVQRRLTRLGFDTRVNGKFDDRTRAVITRWQAARGYPATGFLDTPQHDALLAESVSGARADAGSTDDVNGDHPAHHHDIHHHRGSGGPGGLIGGVVGGLFGHR